jgi:hypothetical protein
MKELNTALGNLILLTAAIFQIVLMIKISVPLELLPIYLFLDGIALKELERK